MEEERIFFTSIIATENKKNEETMKIMYPLNLNESKSFREIFPLKTSKKICIFISIVLLYDNIRYKTQILNGLHFYPNLIYKQSY